MPPRLCPFPGLQCSEHAGVATIEGHPGCLPVAALLAFFEKNKLVERQLRKRMDRWQGLPWAWDAEKYHGWKMSEFGGRYTDCFVFKYNPVRLYGFLCHPGESSQRFLLFIPVIRETKNKWKTETVQLDRVVVVSKDAAVTAVLRSIPPTWRGKS